MSKKTEKTEPVVYKCRTCRKEFKGSGKPGHPFTRCPKCRKE